jgi:hypothetical protein
MYKRIQELKDLQRSGMSDYKISAKIGISNITFDNVINGKNIYKRTEKAIDYFLDNQDRSNKIIQSLIYYKKDSKISIIDLAKQVGISEKTICNTMKFRPVSDSTLKLIENFLTKI